MLKLKGLRSALFSLMVASGVMACGNAQAMAKKQTQSAPQATASDHTPVIADHQQGYELGHRNGTLISQRLKNATLGVDGCSALTRYQKGLTQVARKIRAPQGVVAKHFFRGYLDAVRASIQESRKGCDAVLFEDGEFAGEFYGSLLCSVASSGFENYLALESAPLYANWANGSAAVRDQCVAQAKLTLSSCETSLDEEVASATELHVNVSCAD